MIVILKKIKHVLGVCSVGFLSVSFPAAYEVHMNTQYKYTMYHYTKAESVGCATFRVRKYRFAKTLAWPARSAMEKKH